MMFGSKTKPTNHNVGDSNSSSRKRPNVAFDISMNTIHEVEHRNDIDEEQRSAVWLRQEEYAEIKQTFLVIVRKMMRSTEPVEETDEISCRGLEFRTKAGSRARSRARCKAIWAVLDEQAIQIDEGVQDVDFIADVYRELTTASSLEALNRGLKDQKAMLDILDPYVRKERDLKMKERLTVQSKDVPLIQPVRRAAKVAESLISTTDLQSLKMLVV